MNTEELKKYLKGILDIELSLYVYQNTIEKLSGSFYALGKKTNIAQPKMGTPKTKLIDCMTTAGIISGIIAGIIAFIQYIVTYTDNGLWLIFNIVAWAIAALIVAVCALFAGGLVFGGIAWLIINSRERKQLEEKYESETVLYNDRIKKQNTQLAFEKLQKNALKKGIISLQDGMQLSKQHLKQLYDYNVLEPEYCNVYAVSSIYGYLTKARTFSLGFNPRTGDQGAYNLYEAECRLDKIIHNTEEIIERLDQVIENQYELAAGLQRATQQIDLLCTSIDRSLSSITSSVQSIEQTQCVIAYNTECANRELELLTWMEIMNQKRLQAALR